MSITVVRKNVRSPDLKDDPGWAELSAPSVERFLRLGPKQRARILQPVGTTTHQRIDAITPLHSRLQAWLQLYAQRLEQLGLLGSGEVWLDFERTRSADWNPNVSAAVDPFRNTLRFFGSVVRQQDETALHDTMLHELLHLSRPRRGLAAARKMDYFEELVASVFAKGLQSSLRPDLPARGFISSGTWALPVLYGLLQRSPRRETRSFVDWVWALRGDNALAEIARCDLVLAQVLTPAQQRAVARLYRDGAREDLPDTIEFCALGNHGYCGHTATARFLEALGDEYSAFGFERDTTLASLRQGTLRPDGGDYPGLHYEYWCWSRDLFLLPAAKKMGRSSAHRRAVARARAKVPLWRRRIARYRAFTAQRRKAILELRKSTPTRAPRRVGEAASASRGRQAARPIHPAG